MALIDATLQAVGVAVWGQDSDLTYPATSFGTMLKEIHQAIVVDGWRPGGDVGTRDLSEFPTGGAIIPSRWTGAKLPIELPSRAARENRDLKDIADILGILTMEGEL